MNTKKGFTLLELLIVIGILAILSTTIVLVINPAELLRKARDSQRISDLNTMKTAIAYYVTETSSPKIGSLSTSQTYSDVAGVNCGGVGTNPSATATTTQSTNGTGWIPVEFSKMTGGSPIAALPTDPNKSSDSTGAYYYVYLVGSETDYTFKLVANMESTYYGNTGGDGGDVESTDGGVNINLYEVGTDMDIAITVGTDCYNGQTAS